MFKLLILVSIFLHSSVSLSSTSLIKNFVSHGWTYHPASKTNPFFFDPQERIKGTLTLGDRASLLVIEEDIKEGVTSQANWLNRHFFKGRATVLHNVPLYPGRNDFRVVVFQIIENEEPKVVTFFSTISGKNIFAASMSSSREDFLNELKDFLPHVRKALKD